MKTLVTTKQKELSEIQVHKATWVNNLKTDKQLAKVMIMNLLTTETKLLKKA